VFRTCLGPHRPGLFPRVTVVTSAGTLATFLLHPFCGIAVAGYGSPGRFAGRGFFLPCLPVHGAGLPRISPTCGQAPWPRLVHTGRGFFVSGVPMPYPAADCGGFLGGLSGLSPWFCWLPG
jgi:hypothetical protein